MCPAKFLWFLPLTEMDGQLMMLLLLLLPLLLHTYFLYHLTASCVRCDFIFSAFFVSSMELARFASAWLGLAWRACGQQLYCRAVWSDMLRQCSKRILLQGVDACVHEKRTRTYTSPGLE